MCEARPFSVIDNNNGQGMKLLNWVQNKQLTLFMCRYGFHSPKKNKVSMKEFLTQVKKNVKRCNSDDNLADKSAVIVQ